MNKDKQKKKIALVVDHPDRDLPGLVLLGAELVNKGFNVFLVPHNIKNYEIWNMAPDYVLMNYIRTNVDSFLATLIKAGIPYGVLDTEGGIFATYDLFDQVLSKDDEIRKSCRSYFCWGAGLADHLVKSNWFLESQVTITGCPRMDFYSPELNSAIQKSYDFIKEYEEPVILINCAFPLANPRFKTAEKELNILVENYKGDRDYFAEVQRRQTIALAAFIDLARELSEKFPHEKFVLRPHPFEGIKIYQEKLSKIPNVVIEQRGTVDAWLGISKMLIQKGCSTGVEAGFLGVPTLAPGWVDIVADKRIDLVSHEVGSMNELIESMELILENKYSRPANIDGNLQEIINETYYRNDGKSYKRVAESIELSFRTQQDSDKKLDYLRRKGRLVDLDWRNKLLKSSAKLILDKLNLSHKFNFGQKKRLVQKTVEKWENSTKYFDQERVRSLVDAISGGRSGIHVLPSIKLRSTSLCRYPFARSVAMVQGSEEVYK